MSNDIFTLEGEVRSDIGKGASRRLRRLADQIPAIIYGAGKESTPITLDHKKVLRSLKDEAFYSHILEIKLGKKTEKVVLKDMQRHAFKPKILHMDFLRVKSGEKLQLSVPLHFINDDIAPGVKMGGIVSHLLTEVEIRCLPDQLPEYIEVDLTNLDQGGAIHLSELVLPKGVELIALMHENAQDQVVVNIHKPRGAKEAEAEAATGEEASE